MTIYLCLSMWKVLADFILRYRLIILIGLGLLTGLMAFYASKVKMSYEFNNAIPVNHAKYKEYQEFKRLFGEDGTMLVIGFKKEDFFRPRFFNQFKKWSETVKGIKGIRQILSVADAMNIRKEDNLLKPYPLFENGLDSTNIAVFKNLPFYKDLLYNEKNNVYLTALYLDADIVKSEKRVALVSKIENITEEFARSEGLEIHYSGLPYIRTKFAESIRSEMKLILIFSLIFTAIILLLFFRSFWAMTYSLIVVTMGVIWAMASIYLLGFKITLLTALIPPLIVVIGLPNCIYFLNKYHSEYAETGEKIPAIRRMVERMGIVTLFTNLTTMIGFGVFYFTQSQILKEFGLIAGLNILFVFLISLFALPAIFSYLKEPKARHTRYLENKFITRVLARMEHWAVNHPKYSTSTAAIILIISLAGMLRLEQVGHIVDDLPRKHKIYTDLKFFENNFNGIMPVEILVDTKKKNKLNSLSNMGKIDELVAEVEEVPEFGKALSYLELLKFAKQAYYEGDPGNFTIPNVYDISFIAPYLQAKVSKSDGAYSTLIHSFVDSNRQIARISINARDVGSKKLPEIIGKLHRKANEIFDSSKYEVIFTGTSVVFLEGSKFIIHSLRDSILLAIGMIVICVLLLFRSIRLIGITFIINLMPLIITAGIMGWFKIPLKPSTVLVFSIALGIAIDVTIRFLVNYKQELPHYHYNVKETVQKTIQQTGISILFTSFILAIGFGVFLFSQFDGTRYLGLLTSITLLWSMLINLTILPILLVWFDKPKTD